MQTTPQQIAAIFATETEFDVHATVLPKLQEQIAMTETPVLIRLRAVFERSESRGVTFSALND